MPKFSIQLVRKERELYKKQSKIKHFGPYMVDKYNINNIALLAELDDNIAMLRIIKDHVQEDNSI
jgi:hypothetical protein